MDSNATPHPYASSEDPLVSAQTPQQPQSSRLKRWLSGFAILLAVLVIAAVCGFFYARHWMQSSLHASLPQVDGQLTVTGLSAPVTVARDAHGVPHITAATVEDLVFAQAYITAGDRLWQMDALRRHAAGTLAEILGSSLVDHDTMQRTLQLRAAADRALTVLAADQKHWLDVYASGVNASIAAQHDHLPLEFKILRYTPAPWTPRDSLLVGIAMFQDLTTTFPDELDREALSSKLSPDLLADLYPVGSWRDHPVGAPTLDLTTTQPEIEQVPLDESQSSLTFQDHLRDLQHAKATLAQISARYACEGCVSGSNGWAVSGIKTASGKPLLSSDMHLAHNVPGIWYMASLEVSSKQPGSKEVSSFHVSGVTLPGTPFVIVGHNQHIAWGFTNLGAKVQDLSVEQTRGTGSSAEFQATDGSWHPLLHQSEVIKVKGGRDIDLDVKLTLHGNMATPILSPIYPHDKRSVALRWTLYDPANVTSPFFAINSAGDWKSLCAAASTFGGPAQNLQYADDQGHIGYHAIGRVPVRGSMTTPTQLSPVPTDGRDPLGEWAGYIPFEALPQSFDPPGGIVATANSRVTPDGYPFPITLDWAAPYRNERIWKVLQAKSGFVPADMLTLQTDVYSDFDKVVAQRLAYAIDHANVDANHNASQAKRLHKAADILRIWDGTVAIDSSAAAITDAARRTFLRLVLGSKLGITDELALSTNKDNPINLYRWGESLYAEEQIIVHQPARWLPANYPDWNALLTAAVEKGLADGNAPLDLERWHYGEVRPVDIEHPILSQSPALRLILNMPIGTGVRPQSGDGSTIKQVGRKFGPSERLTVDFGNLDHSTLNIVLGESPNPESPWFMDQWPAWYNGTTLPMPFSPAAITAATAHTLTLLP